MAVTISVPARRGRKKKPSLPKLTLQGILAERSLAKVWQKIREQANEDLVRDPLDHLAFERNLSVNLRHVGFLVQKTAYRPSPHIIARSAKRDGMTRPLGFLEIGDHIILKSIADGMRPQLLKDFPSCVNFSRSKKTAFGAQPSDYEQWFDAWLRHEKKVQELLMQQGCLFVVTGDIANFFPSIQHKLLRQLVRDRTRAREELINLLFFILECMTPRPEYVENPHMGLPQENYDASRTLAHAFLKYVDDAFKNEISENRYARWMDDFVIAVPSENEGKLVLAKLQSAAERVGLYLNPSKSRVLKTADFARGLYPEENRYLDRIHNSVKNERKVRTNPFEKRLAKFLNDKSRRSNWDRVLRRFYTQSRRIESAKLERYSHRHLVNYPASAASILDYLRGRPFRNSILRNLQDYLSSSANLYEDVEIMLYEFFLDWHLPLRQKVLGPFVNLCLDHFFGRNGFRRLLSEQARGLIVLNVYKYGTARDLDPIARYFTGNAVHSAEFSGYALLCLAATGAHHHQAMRVASRLEYKSVRRLHTFIETLEENPASIRHLIKRFIAPRYRAVPNYYYLEPRSMPLIRIARRNREFEAALLSLCENALTLLQNSPPRFQDQVGMRFLRAELDRP